MKWNESAVAMGMEVAGVLFGFGEGWRNLPADTETVFSSDLRRNGWD